VWVCGSIRSFVLRVVLCGQTCRHGWTDNILIFFLSGLQKLEQRAKKCIELRGGYVE
jgi:hypothetical protein